MDVNLSYSAPVHRPIFCDTPVMVPLNSSQTLQNECVHPPGIHVRLVINTVVVGLFCVFGILGNSTSLVVLGSDSTNKVAIFLLKVLAIADNCLLLYCFIFLSLWYGLVPYLEYMHGIGVGVYEISRPYILTVVNPTGAIFQALVIWITVLLAINRYIAVCRPLQASRSCTLKKVKLQVVAVIACVLIFHIPGYFQYLLTTRTKYNPYTGENETLRCLVPNPWINHRVFRLVHGRVLSCIFIHILPLVVLCILNFKVYMEIRAFRKRASAGNKARRTSVIRLTEKEGNISRVMIIIIVVFIVCQLPDRLSQVITPLRRFMNCHMPYLESIFNLLVIVNSSVNFLIYYFVRKSFRRILKQKCCIARLRYSPGNTSENDTATPPKLTFIALRSAGDFVSRKMSLKFQFGTGPDH